MQQAETDEDESNIPLLEDKLFFCKNTFNKLRFFLPLHKSSHSIGSREIKIVISLLVEIFVSIIFNNF